MMQEPGVEVVPSRSRAQIEEWLVTRIAAAANLPPEEVDIHLPIADFDLDSSAIVSLTQELSDWLEQDLPVTTLWEHPNIDGLARALGRQDEDVS